ncbi:MAG: hypothetical protein ACI9FJ_002204 [Alteromonadaceae bacterium]|jgi:hypothetical protein
MAIEKRIKQLSSDEMLALLNASQTFALGECNHDKCELAFIRDTDEGPQAVVKLGGKLVTIDRSGRLSAYPEVKTRS